ncbi:DUF1622 domain-containing protein [Actinoplanes sp. CA-015351]|uniref:DUF1622 domain-containing protein n=1 Tax=Actinoplanes sp. CA-015351 TaxID=3239897 RepID=UPI003D975AC2
MSYDEVMEWVVTGFEITGATILAAGSLLALVSAAVSLRKGNPRAAYKRARQDVGRVILLGLEILIIADIVLTITVERTLQSTLTLGVLVLVRTFLSFSLEIELEGSLPWRRSAASREPSDEDAPAAPGEQGGAAGRANP